jgi:hypothetical protein
MGWILDNPSAALLALVLLSLQQKEVPGVFLRSKALPAHKADNLRAIYEQLTVS